MGALVFLVAASIGMVSAQQPKQPPCTQCAEWNKPHAPFRIFGNSYYVGTLGLASVLITSSSGHVLIDGDLAESVPQIVANIKSLGFRIEDVKLLLNSHVHFDHAGGIAELQRLTGARVVASSWSAHVMREGAVSPDDPQFGLIAPIPAVKQVEELHNDGETLRVGDTSITAHFTPGHTPGGTSWSWKSCEEKKCRDMVYADSVSPVSADGFKFTNNKKYPGAVADFEKTFAFLESTPCDILITPHPEASGLWDRLEARGRREAHDAMVDTAACRHLAEEGRGRLRQRLAEEH